VYDPSHLPDEEKARRRRGGRPLGRDHFGKSVANALEFSFTRMSRSRLRANWSHCLLRTTLRKSSSRLPAAILAAAVLACHPALAQSNHAWTVQGIFGHMGRLAGDPPSGISWSPDGKHATWIDGNGDLMEIEPPGVKPKRLIPYARISSLLNANLSESARSHRSRYDEPDYIWAPDSEHLLFDTNGELWLYDLKTAASAQVGNTGMQSGDDPKFSPNGQYVSYVEDHNLFVQRAEGPSSPLALTQSHEKALLNGEVDWVYLEELDVRSNYFWSPDSTEIAYLQMDERAVPEYPIVDWIPVHAVVEEQRYPQPGDPNPTVRVGVVAAIGGPTHWIKVPMDLGNDYIPRFGWVNPRVVWIETLSRNHQHLNLWFADAHTGQIRLVLQQSEPKYFNTTYDITFAGDHQFFVLSWRDGHTHMYRYSFDAANPLGSEAKLLNQVERGDYEVLDLKAVDAGTQTIWYLSNEGDSRQQQVWAVQFDGSRRRQLTQAPGYHEVDFPAHGGAFIDTYSNLLQPPSVAACYPQADASVPAEAVTCTNFWESARLPGPPIVPPETLELTAADGRTTLYGTLLLPRGKAATHSVPLIVNPYGGPGVDSLRDRWGDKQFLFDQLLAEHGFAVMHVDNRGMANRGREFEQVCYHNFGPPQFADQMASIDQVLRRYPQLDPHRLGWWGWSWGGSFTLFALSHSDSFLAGVAGAPVTNWRDYDSIYTERYMGLPSENAQNYRDDSAVTSAANLHGRILILHGTGDDNVHLENDTQFIQKLIEAGIPYDYNIFPRQLHGVTGTNNQTQLFGAVLEHFERYLMPGTEKPEADGTTAHRWFRDMRSRGNRY
jgi:dipeptidyl-peptidase-4